MVPTVYKKAAPQIPLPYAFLSSDNNTITPVRIMLRTGEINWGNPVLLESPSTVFSINYDTLGSHYRMISLPDVKKCSSLTLTCDSHLSEGWTSGIFKTQSNMFYTLGIYEPKLFNAPFSIQSKKTFIGIDLSGRYCIDIKGITDAITQYLKASDSVKLAIAGEGLTDTFPSKGWLYVDSTIVPTVQSAINQSRVIAAKDKVLKPRILFTDGGDGGNLYFSGAESLATCTIGNSLYNNIKNFNKYDIVTTYWHSCTGHEILTKQQLDSVQIALDNFFENGGTFVEFFAYNRDNNNIAKCYFTSLVAPGHYAPKMLHRNINGPIGHGFPDQIYYDNSAALLNSDSSAVSELLNDKNEPVVISKKIKNGRFILTSLWHMQDNVGVKRALCTVELNLQNQSTHFQLPEILKQMKNLSSSDKISEAVIMSNSDRLITGSNISSIFDSSILKNPALNFPHVKTINLLTGTSYIPPAFTYNNQELYGTGYFLKFISDSTKGMYCDRHSQTWSKIVSQIASANNYFHDNFSLSIGSGVKSSDTLFDSDEDKPYFDDAHFYVGKTSLKDSFAFNLSIKYSNLDSTYSFSDKFSTFGSSGDSSIYFFYQLQVLKQLLNASSFDTSAIVAFAVKNRFLTDFTAFIALEPNDTTHFMKDPKDESGIPTEVKISGKDKLMNLFEFIKIGNFPVFKLKAAQSGTVRIMIFDLSGREIFSQSIWLTSGKYEQVSLTSSALAKGTYIAVAHFNPSNGIGVVYRRIERFIIR
jgi:hypothetical protein